MNCQCASLTACTESRLPRWYAINVQLTRRCQRIITLEELRAHGAGKLRGLTLLQRGNRLSVMPVSDAHWQFILSLE